MPGSAAGTSVEGARAVLRRALWLLLLVSPLPFAGVRPGAVFAIQTAAAVLAAIALVVVTRGPGALPAGARRLAVPAGLLVLIGLLQLVPLPRAVAEWLARPNVEARAAVAEIVPETAVAVAPLSLAPADTLDALLRLVAYVLVGFVTAVCVRGPRDLRTLAAVLAVSGAFQALYGSAEYLSGHQHIFGYEKRHYLDSATGTFINRNHYAGYLAMTLPFALGLALEGLGPRATGRGWRQRIVRWSQPRGLRVLLGAFAAATIWLGVLLSYSRGGLAAALVGTAALALLASRRRAAIVLVSVALVLPISFLAWQEVRAPGERFLADSEQWTSLAGRLPAWRAGLSMVADYGVLGSGLGTFESAFRLYQPPEVEQRWTHLHNDWLQSAVEGGVPATLLVLWIFVGAWRRTAGVRDDGHRGALFARCLAAAILVAAFHALLDFSLRMPAVALTAACIVGAATTLERAAPGAVPLRATRRP